MTIHEADVCKRMYILKGTVAVTSTLCLTIVIVLQADKEHSRPPIDSPTPADLGLTSVDQTHLVALPTSHIKVLLLLLLLCSAFRVEVTANHAWYMLQHVRAVLYFCRIDSQQQLHRLT